MSQLPRGFGWLLRILPESFREQHREDIRHLLADYSAGRSGWSRGLLVARAAADIAWVGLALRVAAVRGARRGSRSVPERKRGALVQTIILDARHGIRSIRRDAGLASFATAIVGLGVGACVTVFSVANALLLRPLPFDAPEQLVFISNGEWGRGQAWSSISVQVSHLQDLRSESRLLTDAAGFYLFDRPDSHVLTGAGDPQRLTRQPVTYNFFPMLGVRPQFGRLFTEEEARDDAAPAVVLSHRFWTRRFASDPNVVGSTIAIDGNPTAVVGVLPPTFDFPAIFAPGTRVDVFSPFPMSERTDRQGNTLALVGRLAPGATLDGARVEARAIVERHATERRNGFNPRISPLRDHVSGGFHSAILVLSGAVGLVMLIVCANLSNLLLARGAAREKEIAIRGALGANRARLVRQLMMESLVLSTAGATLGLALAVGGTQLLSGLDATIPLLGDVRVDAAALGFALLVAIGTGLLFGVAPAWRTSGLALHEALKDGSRGTSAGRRTGWVRGALVVSEVAFACVLLVGAGLLLRSLVSVLNVDPGFQPQQAVALQIDPGTRFPSRAARRAYHLEALRRVRNAPGVEAAGLTDVLPTAFNRRWCFTPTHATAREDDRVCPFVRVVSEDYLRAMGLSLIAGRDFSGSDIASRRPVVLVNELMASAIWPEDDAVGRTLDVYGTENEIIGVVRGMRYLTLEQAPGPEVFFSMRQISDYAVTHLVARGTRPPTDLIAAVRGALRPMDGNLPVSHFTVIQDILDRSMSPRRFMVMLLAGFAGFALMLASLGIYGVISYSVTERRHEIGIRVALGASGAEVQRQVLGDTLRLAAGGLAIGVVGAWMLARVVRGMLYQVTASDPVTFALVPLLLMTVATLAGYLPARRAARLDPMDALRGQTSSIAPG